VLDHGRVRDAVADHLVERGAAGLLEPLVAQRRRVGAVVAHVLVGDAVQLVGGDAGRDGLARLLQRAGGDPARDAHLLDGLLGLYPGLALRLLGGLLPRVLGTFDGARHLPDRGEGAGYQGLTRAHGHGISLSAARRVPERAVAPRRRSCDTARDFARAPAAQNTTAAADDGNNAWPVHH